MRPGTIAIARITLVALMIGLIAWLRPVVAGVQPGTPGATPIATPVVTVSASLFDTSGNETGVAQLAESGDGQVTISVTAIGLSPGEHGIHLHEAGRCDPVGPDPFASAGAHFDPTEGAHGDPLGPESHAGDLGNIVAEANGGGQLQLTSTKVTLSPGPVTLADGDGSALIIHADRDDLGTDPDGASGSRIICGVIFPPMGTPAAATPTVATPVT